MRTPARSDSEDEKMCSQYSEGHSQFKPPVQQLKRESSVSNTRNSRRVKVFTDDDFDLELARMSGGKSKDNKMHSKLKKVKSVDSQEMEESTTAHAITSQVTSQKTNKQDVDMDEALPSRPVYR